MKRNFEFELKELELQLQLTKAVYEVDKDTKKYELRINQINKKSAEIHKAYLMSLED